jgi:hypothetical protein
MAQPIAANDLDTPIHVPAWAWLVVAFAVLVTYLVTLDNGVLLGHLAENAHEFFHDARHFTGFPCH